MKKYKVGVIGYFAAGKSKAGGQEAKTCSIDRAMREKYGNESVYNVDTTCWKRHPLKLLVGIVLMCAKCENIIMLPAQNGLKIFIPLFELLNIIFNKKLFYSVVGGWLPIYLKKNKRLQKQCRKLNGIFVETRSMKVALNDIGIKNVSVIPNFKYLTPITISSVKRSFKKPYTLCTFSRIMKEKGIEDIIEAVTQINQENNEVIYTLDIYGKIDDAYVKRFEILKEKFPEYINYAGMVEPNQSVETIKSYFGLVFPTHYYTEGVPGTLIDACMAGVPVVSALWGNYQDVFVEDITGWGYEFGNQNALINVLKRIVNSPDEFCKLRELTLKEAERYFPDKNIELITKQFK